MYGKDFDYDNIPPDRRLPIPPEAIEEPSEVTSMAQSFCTEKNIQTKRWAKPLSWILRLQA